jgi:hypothetical protein
VLPNYLLRNNPILSFGRVSSKHYWIAISGCSLPSIDVFRRVGHLALVCCTLCVPHLSHDVHRFGLTTQARLNWVNPNSSRVIINTRDGRNPAGMCRRFQSINSRERRINHRPFRFFGFPREHHKLQRCLCSGTDSPFFRFSASGRLIYFVCRRTSAAFGSETPASLSPLKEIHTAASI